MKYIPHILTISALLLFGFAINLEFFTGIDGRKLGATDASCSGLFFTFDEKKVGKIVPNHDTNTATVFLKDGKSKTFAFECSKKAEFENAAKNDSFLKIK